MEITFGESTQIVLLFGSVIGLIYSVLWTKKRKDMWFIGMPIAIMLLHSCIYYSVVVVSLFNGINLLNYAGVNNFPAVWSAVLRLHFVITTIACLYMVDRVFDIVVIKFKNKGVNQCPTHPTTQSG